ncbi:hypothetical protein PV04_03121 [Phialophora macrospora]|uniref:Uncharacterized protein n=1 Tax=Phialophora macrospora TaxID=1851006 RepID=A0A0D2FRC3_9EURO|nr:hypothetical protein PV04_03121 [Phialophora macrospora]
MSWWICFHLEHDADQEPLESEDEILILKLLALFEDSCEIEELRYVVDALGKETADQLQGASQQQPTRYGVSGGLPGVQGWACAVSQSPAEGFLRNSRHRTRTDGLAWGPSPSWVAVNLLWSWFKPEFTGIRQWRQGLKI